MIKKKRKLTHEKIFEKKMIWKLKLVNITDDNMNKSNL
jgi:hypothetical protein